VAGKPRVLWVSEEAPDRSLGGGSIRQAHLFRALADAFPTDLLLAGSLRDESVRATASGVTEIPKRRPPWSKRPAARRALQLAITLTSRDPTPVYPVLRSRRALARLVAERASSYEIVCVEHEALAPLARALGGTPAVITFHHLVSEMLRQELAHTAGGRQRWLLERDLSKARSLERLALRDYSRVITCSREDAAALSALDATSRIEVVPNGVDLSAFAPTELPREPRVLFPGSLAYAPNVDGARWFCAEVWPRVRTAVPAARLAIAGREPVAEIRALAGLPGIEVHADVPSMVDWFRWARVVTVPLRVGTGTRLKALEAMAAARPVVGTTVGLDGIGVEDGRHAFVRDDPGEMAEAIVALLEREAVARELADAARAHVQARFDWEQIAATFVALVSELAPAPAAAPLPAGQPALSGTPALWPRPPAPS
jgi:glycosyltransferase involved in cell wall biosynthesis